jgi:Tfp pilus assembly PilM family ATPase
MSFLPRPFRRSFSPDVAIEIAPRSVSAVSLVSTSREPAIAAHGTAALPEGAVVPSLTGRNLPDRTVVADAVAQVLERVGRPRRVGLLVPDPVAKVSLLRFERVPERRTDLDQLIRWQLRKAAPFAMDEAQIAWSSGPSSASGQDIVVTMARREVIEEYEAVCASAGAHAGMVDLSTLNLINAVLASRTPPRLDWLLVNASLGYVSVGVVRGSQLLFFRTRGFESAEDVTEAAHQTAMYYEDRLDGRKLERLVLSVAGGHRNGHLETTDVHRMLEQRLAVPIESADARSVTVSGGPSGSSVPPDVLPLVGLLLRDKDVA